MTVRIVIADDHAIVRGGLRALIGAVDGFELVGEADSASGAIEAVLRQKPDVVLLDIQMPGSGIIAAREITRGSPGVGILMLTMFEDDASVDQSLAAGALGYVLKGADPEEIVRAIEGVAGGGAVLGTPIARRVLGGRRSREPAPGIPQLSTQEGRVLDLIASGLGNPAIAERLVISPHTVGNHISNIFRKLGVATRAEAIVRAREAGYGR
jgi:DNA-binding NarL/FixJ family response regulator